MAFGSNRSKIRCLVVQMAGLGDLFQSLMAFRAVKQLYPQVEIHLVVKDRLAKIAKRVPWVEEVHVLPNASIVETALSSPEGEHAALRQLAGWVSTLVSETWDITINHTFSDASSYLTSIIPARVKLGYSRRSDATFSCVDGWSHYVQAVLQGQVDQDIHIIDIMTTQVLTAMQIHFGEPSSVGDAVVTSKSFFQMSDRKEAFDVRYRKTARKWIAIQIGEENSLRSWSYHYWADLMSLVLEKHHDVGFVVLGTPGEKSHEEKLMGRVRDLNLDENRIISLVGQSDFELWANVISDAQWFIGADSPAIHLASVLGTRVVQVGLNSKARSQSGPYGNGHYVVSSREYCEGCSKSSTNHDEHTCGSSISPEAVYTTWEYGSTEWMHQRQESILDHFQYFDWENHSEDVQIYRSEVRSTDLGGGVRYESMIDRPIRFEEWTSGAIGYIARAWYCGWTPQIGNELSRQLISPELIRELRELSEAIDVFKSICRKGIATSDQFYASSAKLKSDRLMGVQTKKELQVLGKKIFEIDALIERMGYTKEPLRALARLSRVLTHNLRGEKLVELGESSRDAYSQVLDGVDHLERWVDATLSMVKPKAVGRDGGKVVELHGTV